MIDLKRKIDSKLRNEVKIEYTKRLKSYTVIEHENIKKYFLKYLKCIENANQSWIRHLYLYLKVMYAQVLLGVDEFESLDKDLIKIGVALNYFIDQDDIIPDHVVGDGFIDDAIFTNLVLSKLSKNRKNQIVKMFKIAQKGI